MSKYDYNTALSSSFYLNDEHYIVQAHFEAGEVSFWNEYVRLVRSELETDLNQIRRQLQKTIDYSGSKVLKMTYRHNGFVDPNTMRLSHVVILNVERKRPVVEQGNFDYFMSMKPTMSVKQEPPTHESTKVLVIDDEDDDDAQVTASQNTLTRKELKMEDSLLSPPASGNNKAMNFGVTSKPETKTSSSTSQSGLRMGYSSSGIAIFIYYHIFLDILHQAPYI